MRDTGLNGELQVIVAPQRCYEAPALAAGQRVWGVAVQLYSLRSPRNWGMGDFRDLRELITLAAPLGCGIVGLNPLHALLPADPAQISPYSPCLLIEVHPNPEEALCDGEQSLKPRAFRPLMEEMRSIAQAVGREI